MIYLDGLRDGEACQRELEAALAIDPGYTPALLNLANLYEDRGDRTNASKTYERLLKLNPSDADALSRLAGLERADNPDTPMIARLATAIAAPGMSFIDKATLGFALGRLYDSCAAYDQAFDAYDQANRDNRAAAPHHKHDRSADARRVESTIAAFHVPRSGHTQTTARSPVFILGMFRSGSTLIEQILASHPSITSGGELDLIPRIAQALGGTPQPIVNASEEQISQLRKRYLERTDSITSDDQIITDKRPDNFWHIGLIKRLFPDAKIIHTTREPRDNCLSVLFQHLDPSITYAGDLVDCGHHLLAERAMMKHWKTLWPSDILSVEYSAVTGDLRGETTRILDFLSLDWDDACVDFHKTQSLVRTASVWQVREPIHSQSVARWRNYEAQLRDLTAMLETADRN